ncbi:MAG: acyltransferase family protein [Halobacteriovoraceae bacterium]|jgi:1-acyl-sn-glycerol-3-phosphate acyltransferase|nr:acyltransferase family protein [Halobacteriovoraceae bacterium]
MVLSKADQQQKEKVFNKLRLKYKDYNDPWGFNLETIKQALEIILPFYKNYFRVRVFGKENIKDTSYMIVSNHTGQVPIDGALITMAFAYEFDQPRVLHSMVERFMAGLPFIGDLSAQTGAILGDRDNCKWLLSQDESILVFPEGTRGINKSTKNFYKLQRFPSGFYRIALQAQRPIVPISVIGAEEMFPFVLQAPKLGKKLGLPSLPIPFNLFPLPAPIDIYIGKPINVPTNLSSDAPEKEIRPYVQEIEESIKMNIEKGLKDRREFFDRVRNPIQDFMKKL